MSLKFFKIGMITSLAVAGVVATGCAGAKGNGAVSSSLVMTGSGQSATVAKVKIKSPLELLIQRAMAYVPAAIVDRTGATVTLAQAWIAIKEIEFEQSQARGAGETDGSEVSFKGPYFVDLLSNTPVTLDTQSIAANPYQRIKMKLEKNSNLPVGTPAQLANNSIYIQAAVGGVNFTYLNNDGTEIEMSGVNPVVPKNGQDMLVAVQLANIFKQIYFAGNITNGAAISATNRVPGTHLCDSIDPSANDLYTCIRKGFEQQGDFGVDTDKTRDLTSIGNTHVK